MDIGAGRRNAEGVERPECRTYLILILTLTLNQTLTP